MLASVHNLHYYLNLMRELREALDAGEFAAYRRASRRARDRRASARRRWVPRFARHAQASAGVQHCRPIVGQH